EPVLTRRPVDLAQRCRRSAPQDAPGDLADHQAPRRAAGGSRAPRSQASPSIADFPEGWIRRISRSPCPVTTKGERSTTTTAPIPASARLERVESAHGGCSAERREPLEQFPRVLLPPDGGRDPEEHVALVELFDHPLDRHAGLLVAGENRGLHRRRSPVAREQR